VLLYAITSRNLLPGSEAERNVALIELAHNWAEGGVDYIQIREKDLLAPDLLALARSLVTAVREENHKTRVLVNGPAEIALQAEADGVHLPASAPTEAAEQVRHAFRKTGREAIVSRSCHSLQEIRAAGEVSLIVFAPVFEKVEEQDRRPGVGLAVLSEACRAAHPVPVIALGGVTTANAAECVDAGAAGVAGIRLFLGDEWRRLRSF
jgi:thiamine-phosphate pyrophosphorylase